ncbi:MAG TPA: polysaccharide biosynthesis/export family protein [Bacteroidales bacterium]|nr:polysaccharide biosynthesis/export family protein [Bacteroidales bacterium]
MDLLKITSARLILLAFATMAVIACVPQKKMLYLQQEADNAGKTHFENERALSYLVQPGDNLIIRVVSLDDRMSALFNPMDRTQNVGYSDQTVFLNSYTVDERGQIDFPLAGKITVQNLTTEQIKERLKEVLDIYLKETVIIVKLVNFNLTVLGEVRRPGQYKVYQSEINIFEAIAMSGDLTEFADRSEVVIVRQTKTGSEIITVNLEKASILSSDYYYLKPNDIIYVRPLKIKQFGFATFPYSLIFTTISTALLLINFFK